ncbi:MAG: methionine synthase [bacterium]|nr:methionine synthase [bacterium]
MTRLTRTRLAELAARRILVLDGAMGTMIQAAELDEAGFRGERFADHPQPLQGNNDLLCLTQPEVICGIHAAYFAAGADIATTNTFNGTSVSQSDYGTAHLVREINQAAARLAREAADAATAGDPERPRFVAGSLAPTNRTCSISPDVDDPSRRNITFNELVAAYTEAAEGLLDGGADILAVETIFDPLNAKAAVFALDAVLRRRGLVDFPVWISGTITDASGRTLTGQTPEAFWISLRHADPAVFGLNCALGATAMWPFVEEISAVADTLVSAYPNAGLPNEMGGYDETPEQMAAILGEFAEAGLLNIVGGCCGTTPEHIAAIAAAVEGVAPRPVPAARRGTHLAGLEPLIVDDESLFVNVGERTNVAGSRKFARLIHEEKWEEALEVGRQQVRGGAQIVDVNMDDAMLDAPAAMATFLNVLAGDPEIARVPVMIDSSDWSVIEAGLQRIQGKGVVNSLSLKDGEPEFRRRARLVRRYGAAAVVMAFDEAGQADSLDRRLDIVARAWRVLVQEEGFAPADVIFDPNVFAVATGLPEHATYAMDFIETCRFIKENCPGALVSGGISNLSFSFRGNNTVREAMHSSFLYHAIGAGLDLGIVNAGQLAVYEEIDPELLQTVEDVLFNRDPEATDRLTELATRVAGHKTAQTEDLSWRVGTLAERLAHALLSGDARFVEEDTLAALAELPGPLQVIEGPLMAGMDRVGQLFGEGKMFLPQVIRSARVMKRAVNVLEPYLEEEKRGGASNAGKVLMATVKGDVHDIGKNIVGVVLGCNNYEVIDLGVMVPVDRIIETAVREEVDIIGLSGLITPSLSEMVHVAQEMQRAGLDIPLLIGGATTSRVHTAVKIAPFYAPGVIHVPDASRAAGVIGALIKPETRSDTVRRVAAEYERVRSERAAAAEKKQLLTLTEARAGALELDWSVHTPERPKRPGVHRLTATPATLAPFIDWTPFFHTWRLLGRYPAIFDDAEMGAEAQRLHGEALELLEAWEKNATAQVRAVAGLFPAARDGDDVIVYTGEDRSEILRRVPFLRQQRRSGAGRPNLSLVDFMAPAAGPEDWLGAFVVSVTGGDTEAARLEAAGDDFGSILAKALADRLAEAAAEWLHLKVRRELWGYAPDESIGNEDLIAERFRGIRPAPGYPACPDHVAKGAVFELLDATAAIGASLTDNFAMAPAASVAGWYLAHPEARYFGMGRIGRDQALDYAARAGITNEEAVRLLAANLD